MKNLEKELIVKIDSKQFYTDTLGKFKGNMPCPFPERHKSGEDTHPSFVVFENGGSFCHGCGYKSSNIIYFYADYRQLTHDDALKSLWHKYIEKIIPVETYMSSNTRLLTSPFVLKRLDKFRGLNVETIKQYKLGYDNNRLTIPIMNEAGWCVNIRRYDLYKDQGPKVISFAKGYGTSRLYPLTSLKYTTVYIFEGELDALLACQHNIPGISASCGAGSWKNEWGKLFKDKIVYIIPDNDEPGRKGAALKLIKLRYHAKTIKIINLPVKEKGEDFTDWILKYGGTQSKLNKLTKKLVLKNKKINTDNLLVPRTDLFADNKTKYEEIMIERAELVLNTLKLTGAFFKNSNNELFYASTKHAAMKVTNTLGPFMAHLLSISPLTNQASSTGKFIYNHVLNSAYLESKFTKSGSWAMFEDSVLYVHKGEDEILKLGEKEPEVIKNAINDDRILLEIPFKSMTITKMPNYKPLNGLKLLNSLYADYIPMRIEDRYLLICWLLSSFFKEYVRPKPIIRLLAKTASGKSTTSKLTSILLYGTQFISHAGSSIAATYEMSTRYPLLILDNLETKNMTESLENFLLVASTGAMKVKRKRATDQGIIFEQLSSLILTNGIEPFNKHELIDRTIELNLDIEKYGNTNFNESKLFKDLLDARQEIFSSLLFLIWKYVIPRIRKGELIRIMREFNRHGKERFNEHFALMAIILDALWGYMPIKKYNTANSLVNFWLDSQTKIGVTQDTGTNEILYFLETLLSMKDQIMGLKLNYIDNKLDEQFKITTRNLLTNFRLVAKQLSIKCPWENERQLGVRLADSDDILYKAGWIRTRSAINGRTHYKYLKLKSKGK